ncbi:MAG TPA: DMT family transporter [Acidimicrobiales bacterium]|nr:DMT family transporter [Acidimicrobiales bacterium]
MRRLLLLAFVWGWSFLFIKVGVEGMTPTAVAAARITLGALALQLVLRLRKTPLPTDRTFWRHAAVTAVLANIIPFTLLAWGEERITSALTAVLNASTPLFTVLAGGLLLKDRVGKREIAGLALGMVGVAVAAGVGGSDFADSSVWGSAAAVGAGAGYGAALAYTKKHLLGVPAEIAATGQLTAGAVMLLPVAALTTATEGIDLEPHRVLAIVLLGAVGTGFAYLLYYRSVAELGPTTTSLVTYLIPPIAVVVGVVALDETFHWRVVFGGALIVAGIAIVQDRLRWPGRRAPVPAATGG